MATYFLSSASGAAGLNNGTSWANAYKTLDACLTRTGPALTGGDVVYVGDDHSEAIALVAGKTLTFPTTINPPLYMYCVDHTKASPGAGDLKTTATMGYSGAFALVFNQNLGYCYGINWTAGTGVSGAGANIQIGNNNTSSCVFENCTFTFAGTQTSANVIFTSHIMIFINCTFKWTANNQNIITSGNVSFINCTFDSQGTINSGGAINVQAAGVLRAEDCDFSAIGATTVLGSLGQECFYVLKRCKLHTGNIFSTQSNGPWSLLADVIQCDVGGGSLLRNERYHANGTLTTSVFVARVGGMLDSTTPISHRCITSASARWLPLPFHTFPIAVWNSVVGTPINVTIEFIADPRASEFAAIPKNDECWIDVEYLGTAGSTRGSTLKGTKASVLDVGTAQTASTADWTAGTMPSRQNSFSYVLGQPIKVASNSGRVFFCSVAGTSAASEPAGYASAVDGGSITDGGATFKAGWRFKQTLTVTPQIAGLLYVQPKIAKASIVGGIYIDPLITLS